MASDGPRPLLLPQNRKLRHLQGIYLRNLTLSRPRGQTIDDGALNKSPGKLEAIRSHQLHHSHSSSELSSSTFDLNIPPSRSSTSSQLRPSAARRTSTAWVGATPDFRQKKLEDVIDSRMADSFFTLHIAGQDEPIYISEVVERAMNPTYRFFDLSSFGPTTTRLDRVTVKIWVKRQDFSPLVEEVVDLRTLQFVGRLENHAFPANCILFHLVDGIYTIDLSSKPPKPKDGLKLPTSSYNALMRLSNLDESIQDALATREALASQINAILTSTPVDEAPQAQEDAALASKFVTQEKKVLKHSLRRRAELKASIEARKTAISVGRTTQITAHAALPSAEEKLASCRSLQHGTTAAIHGQRRRICEELLTIFPIEPVSPGSLLFTICSLQLPNSTFDDADEDNLSAALGYVARVVDMLQYYLSIPLPYPLSPYGSRSLIHDPISILDSNARTFPLYPKSTIKFRFDYGVFLLNKNIECLAESQGLKVVDIRQTLPNLKYLLYVCSAGSEELPLRKKGGVRGLISGRMLTTPTISRRGSDESGFGGDGVKGGGDPRQALEAGNGNGKLDVGKKEIGRMPFGDHRQSFRGSGLRENLVSR